MNQEKFEIEKIMFEFNAKSEANNFEIKKLQNELQSQQQKITELNIKAQ